MKKTLICLVLVLTALLYRFATAETTLVELPEAGISFELPSNVTYIEEFTEALLSYGLDYAYFANDADDTFDLALCCSKLEDGAPDLDALFESMTADYENVEKTEVNGLPVVVFKEVLDDRISLNLVYFSESPLMQCALNVTYNSAVYSGEEAEAVLNSVTPMG